MPTDPASDREQLLRDRLRERLDRAQARTPGIPRRPADGPAPLSPMQESIWLLQRMDPEGTTYHRPVALRLSGPLDPLALRAALGDLVERHEALRTVFRLVAGRPRQEVQPPSVPDLDLRDVSETDDPEAEALALAAEVAHAPFDLARGPLLRARLFRLGEDDHLLVLALHHIAFDGWSEGALRADLATAYAARQRGEAPTFDPLPVQMADVAAWQRQRQADGAYDAGLAYWREQLDGPSLTLDLPTDRPRAGAGAAASAHTFTLPADLAGRLRALAREEGTTLYMVLLATFEVLLFRYARQGAFVVGAPVAGRTHTEMEGVVGCLFNLLAVRARVDGDEPFRALLDRVRQTVVEALDHQDVPMADVIRDIAPDRRGFSPIYQVQFQLRNLPPPEAGGPLDIRPARVPPGGLDMDLALDTVDLGEGGLSCWLAYRADLFDAATIGRMAEHYCVLLDAAVSDPARPVGQLPMLTPDERHYVLAEVQTPALPPSDVGGVHVLVERQAARNPGAVAVVSGDEAWTYGELNARANRLAHRLGALGVGPGVAVALGIDQSPELLGAVLAVHKAGGAYVPLDPEDPEARIRMVLEGVRPPLLLVRGEPPWPGLDALDVAVLDLDALDLSGEPDTDPQMDGLPPDRPAYVLYTSGSTGEPKGVVITQANLLAAVPGWARVYRLGTWRAFLQTARPTFDVFTEAWIRALGFGARLVLCPRDTLLDPPGLVRLIRESRVDVLSSAPAVYRLLTTFLEETGQRLDGVGLALTGADVWRPDDHARLRAVLPNADVLNAYGITETTVSNTVFEGAPPTLPSGTVPIGRAYPNSLLYVLDRYGAPVPIGVPGELYIGGPVVGAGYVGRPDLTADRFLPDPFSEVPGARMYKSGDLVRWLPSGDLDFLGRTDFQVKLRGGLRVELGEIEAALATHPSVAEAIATVQRGERDDDALVAYVVATPGASVDVTALQTHARALLPAYMVPTAFAVLDRLPLSPNGKVDRRALAAVEVGAPQPSRGGPPQTPEETGLAEIWAEVLGQSEVGRDDDFFDLGGHSLRAMQVLSRVQQRWGVALAFRDLVETPTLAALAEQVRQRRAELDEVTDLLGDLESLSDEEAQALLGGS